MTRQGSGGRLLRPSPRGWGEKPQRGGAPYFRARSSGTLHEDRKLSKAGSLRQQQPTVQVDRELLDSVAVPVFQDGAEGIDRNFRAASQGGAQTLRVEILCGERRSRHQNQGESSPAASQRKRVR